MVRKTGSADPPLHGGRVPPWLADRTTRLGAVISEAIVHHYGRDELLRRLAHPFWFQSFGAAAQRLRLGAAVRTAQIRLGRKAGALSWLDHAVSPPWDFALYTDGKSRAAAGGIFR